jgi:arylsulfatase A-like enzyme
MLAGDNGSSFDPKSEVGSLFDQASNGLRGYKRGLYEGALRQAALARWPGKVPAGRVSDEPWAFWDFLPTAAELAGAPIPAECKTDGLSLVNFLKGGPAPKRDHFYWELHEGASLQAVRFGDWKAVRNGPEKPIELYDLKTDAAEANNLAASKARSRCQGRSAHEILPHRASRLAAGAEATREEQEEVKHLLAQRMARWSAWSNSTSLRFHAAAAAVPSVVSTNCAMRAMASRR